MGRKNEFATSRTRVEGRKRDEKQKLEEEQKQGAMTEQTTPIQVDKLEQPAVEEESE